VVAKIYIKIVFVVTTCFAQPTLEWARTYNGPQNQTDVASAVFVDDSGYVYVTGIIALSTNRGDRGTIKYRPNGDSVWVRLYGQPSTIESGSDIFVDNSGSVFVTGVPVLQKYDRNGNLLWTRTDSLFNELIGGNKILSDSTGNIFVLSPVLNSYYVLTKYNNSTGNIIWRIIILARNSPYDMAIDKHGNIYIAGIYDGPFPPRYQDFCVVKCSPNGDSLWSWIYNGPDPQQPYDAAQAITVDDSGYIYATGVSDDINGTGNWFTVKLTPDGDTLWTRRFNIGGSGAWNINLDKQGNIYVSGITNITRATVVKYSNDGTFQWSRTLPHTMIIGYLPFQTLDSNGSVYIAATSQNIEGLQMAKYNSMGEQLWFINHIYTEPRDIIIKNNNVYVTGGYHGDDMITLKYSQSTGIDPISNEVPKEYKLFQNYPNPFNPLTTIEFDVPAKDFVTLKIYDVLGREVSNLISEELKAGRYKYVWDAGSLPSGLYFYKLQTKFFSETKKLVLIK